jgi:hypothetical protein
VSIVPEAFLVKKHTFRSHMIILCAAGTPTQSRTTFAG